MISAGDLFDSIRPSSTDLDCVSTMLRNIKILLYVDGNHDGVTPSILPSLGTNVIHLQEQYPYNLNGYGIYGIDYCNNKEALIESLSKVSEAIKADGNKKHRPLLIMHQSLDVFFMTSIISLQEIREILNTPCDIFVGDIHMRKMLDSEQGRCMSPGPLVPQDIAQAKHQQCATRLIFDSHSKQVKIEDIPMHIRKFTFLDSPDKLQSTAVDTSGRYPLPEVLVVKAPPSYKLPKEYSQNEEMIVILDTASKVLKKEAVQKATADSLEEAVKAEIEATEADLADVMIPFLGKLMHSENPDEVMLDLLKQWKVVMV